MRVKHNEEQIRNIERKLQRVETMDIPKNRIESKPNLNDKIKIYNEEQYEYDDESEK